MKSYSLRGKLGFRKVNIWILRDINNTKFVCDTSLRALNYVKWSTTVIPDILDFKPHLNFSHEIVQADIMIIESIFKFFI